MHKRSSKIIENSSKIQTSRFFLTRSLCSGYCWMVTRWHEDQNDSNFIPASPRRCLERW